MTTGEIPTALGINTSNNTVNKYRRYRLPPPPPTTTTSLHRRRPAGAAGGAGQTSQPAVIASPGSHKSSSCPVGRSDRAGRGGAAAAAGAGLGGSGGGGGGGGTDHPPGSRNQRA